MQILSPFLRIGVLRGGPSPEYDISLKSGAEVLRHLNETHKPVDIFVSRDNKWHIQGLERSPERILKQVDVVWNALHGAYGEDGRVQEVLNYHGIPYTGSDKFSSALGVNKQIAKERISSLGVKTPVYLVVRNTDSAGQKAKEIWNGIPNPLLVKPGTGGSSLGVSIAKTFTELLMAMENILSQYESVLVEEYISGKAVSCYVTDNFRGQSIYAFPPTGVISIKEREALEDIAKRVHSLFSLSLYSKSDFVVSPRRGIYFLEVNTTPKLQADSTLLESLAAVGVSVKDFIHHVISLALGRK